MNKIRLLCACSLISLCTGLCSANASTKCTQASIVGCKETVFETPAGVIDGKNSGFVLKRIPLSSESVHLFLNHIELTQGPDFRVTGQNLTLFGNAVPNIGDDISAMYQVQQVDPTTPMPTKAGIATSREVVSADQTSIILQAALAEAVASEQVPLATPTRPRVVVSKQFKEASIVEDRRNMRSLSLLARRIDSNLNGGSARSYESGQQLTGFDGLGDIPATSRYSVLLGAELTNTAQLLKASPGASTRSLSSAPRSILMLQRRFNAVASGEDENTSKR